jgi:hypothetical protein
MQRYRWISSLLLLATLILSACEPLSSVSTWDEIFVIGEEDKSYSEFASEEDKNWSEFVSGGFDQYQEYICQIDVDCTVEDIPAGLYEGDSPRGYSDEVPKLTIVFQLSRDYSELMLRLARGGSETTAVPGDYP